MNTDLIALWSDEKLDTEILRQTNRVNALSIITVAKNRNPKPVMEAKAVLDLLIGERDRRNAS